MPTLTGIAAAQKHRSHPNAKGVRNSGDSPTLSLQRLRAETTTSSPTAYGPVSTNSALRIDSDVPFGDCIYWWLKVRQGQDQDVLFRASHLFDRPFLAWETVRKARNPYFDQGTGFEGYLVGRCPSAEEAIRRIVQIGQDVWNSITRLYRFDSRFRTVLLKTLTGERIDLKAMAEWSAQFGAVLAKLRCNLLNNREADAFRTETYRVVKALPPLDYRETDHMIRQTYTLDCSDVEASSRLFVSASGLKLPEQEGWLIAKSIGKFGHPLIREFIRSGVG